jgi:hypothetical protein
MDKANNQLSHQQQLREKSLSKGTSVILIFEFIVDCSSNVAH